MESPEKKIFQFPITVSKSHLDDLKHVNNVVYVQWMQEAANRHWKSCVSEELDQQVLWMVRRHEIEYLAQAFLDDELVMRTWTGDYSAVTWDRHYEIVRPADGKKIIAAKSVWVLLEKKTQKPRRIDKFIGNVFE